MAAAVHDEVAPVRGPTLLVVDDEPAMLRGLVRTLDEQPFRVIGASCAKDALAILAKEPVHVILSDHDMPETNGLDLLRMVRLRHPNVMRLMVTATSDFDVAVRAINLGEVARFIRKPWDDDELICSINQAFEQAALEREVRKLRDHVRKSRQEIARLEERFPGIGSIRRDDRGAILLDEDMDETGRVDADALWRE